MGAIYCVESTITGKRYIGKTTQKYVWRRWVSHKHNARNGASSHFYNAIRKYGEEAWVFKVLLSNIPNNLLDKLEIAFISFYNTYHDGYNSTIGGEGTVGNKLTAKHIAILKDVHTGNKYGLGWKPNEEQRRKMSKIRKGTHLSVSTKDKLSKMKQGHKHPNSKKANVFEYSTNKLIAENICIREWCRSNSAYCQSALSSTARGEVKQHKGIYAKYV